MNVPTEVWGSAVKSTRLSLPTSRSEMAHFVCAFNVFLYASCVYCLVTPELCALYIVTSCQVWLHFAMRSPQLVHCLYLTFASALQRLHVPINMLKRSKLPLWATEPRLIWEIRVSTSTWRLVLGFIYPLDTRSSDKPGGISLKVGISAHTQTAPSFWHEANSSSVLKPWFIYSVNRVVHLRPYTYTN